jgi:hypothetical protein
MQKPAFERGGTVRIIVAPKALRLLASSKRSGEPTAGATTDADTNQASPRGTPAPAGSSADMRTIARSGVHIGGDGARLSEGLEARLKVVFARQNEHRPPDSDDADDIERDDPDSGGQRAA